jgi:hypothetical protein
MREPIALLQKGIFSRSENFETGLRGPARSGDRAWVPFGHCLRLRQCQAAAVRGL